MSIHNITDEDRRREEMVREDLSIESILTDHQEKNDGEIRYSVYRNLMQNTEFVLYDEVTGYFRKGTYNEILKMLRP